VWTITEDFYTVSHTVRTMLLNVQPGGRSDVGHTALVHFGRFPICWLAEALCTKF